MYFSALFVISEEMLTNPRPYSDESSEWTFDRFWNPGQTKKKKMDYFGFFVLIAGDVNAFVNVVSDFFTKQLLFETEEAENALMFVLFFLSLFLILIEWKNSCFLSFENSEEPNPIALWAW